MRLWRDSSRGSAEGVSGRERDEKGTDLELGGRNLGGPRCVPAGTGVRREDQDGGKGLTDLESDSGVAFCESVYSVTEYPRATTTFPSSKTYLLPKLSPPINLLAAPILLIVLRTSPIPIECQGGKRVYQLAQWWSEVMRKPD